MCEGTSKQTGLCNQFECGDISPQTYHRIRHELSRQVFNIYAKEGDNVSFTSPTALINRVKRESGINIFEWKFNNKPLDICNFQVKSDCKVTINAITKAQSGTYICSADTISGQTTPIKVVVVAVETIEVEKAVIVELNGILVCDSHLQKIYSHLLVKWYLNGILVSARDLATIDFKSVLKVPLHNITGVWTCVMEQLDLGLRWTVLVYKLDVETDFATNLEDFISFITANFHDWIIVSISICLFMLLCTFLSKCLRLCWKGRRKYKKSGSYFQRRESEIQLVDTFVNRRPLQISRVTVCRRDSELVNLIEEDENINSNDEWRQ